MLNCRIGQNISKVCDTVGNGIYDTIYLYDIDDIEGIVFSNDTRFDNGYRISSINSSKGFYTWSVSDGEYSEQSDGDDYTHELKFNIHKTEEIENILSDAKNSHLLAVFRLRSETVFRVIGWDLGVTLNYELSAGEDGNYYAITFSYEGVYPAFECDADNFDVKNKIFEPVFNPDFDISTCETSTDGTLTGYRIASYVVKTNTAGEPLDGDNKLCEYSGNKQCAYKLEGLSDNEYDILGTYASDAVYNGTSVKRYDNTHCARTGKGTISVSPTSISISEHYKTNATLTLATDDAWSIVNNTDFLSLSANSGNGNYSVGAVWNGIRSDETQTLAIHNENTNETLSVNADFYGIEVFGSTLISHDTQLAKAVVKVYGGSKKFSVAVSCSDPNVVYSYIPTANAVNISIASSSVSKDGAVYTLVFKHADNENETVTYKITQEGYDASAEWVELNTYCETENGVRTGYSITVYEDHNPNSPTYMTRKEEKAESDDCKKEEENWVVISQICLTDDEGYNTGVKVITMMQMTEGYDTYQTTKTVRVVDTDYCPLVTDEPIWKDQSYICLTDVFGLTGVKQVTQVDTNPKSSTYNTTRTYTEGDEKTCPPTTDSYWVVISKTCMQSGGVNTGWQQIEKQNANPRSSTYGEQILETTYNETDCPISTTPVWTTKSTECTVDEYGGNTGEVKITQVDTNPKSSTYNTERTITDTDTTLCPLPSTDPNWVTESYECELDSDSQNTGECTKTQRDGNRYSDTYDTVRTITETDTELCPTTNPKWEVQSYECETDAYGQTGNKVTTYIDTNPKSSSYGTTKTETALDTVNCIPNTKPYWITESTECEVEK